MGAEIGISTQKLHARGPMALPELNIGVLGGDTLGVAGGVLGDVRDGAIDTFHDLGARSS